jgi:acetyl-CoA C-acetyltransferase
MGCTKFGERWDANPEDLAVEAFMECLEDAGIKKKDIQAAWLGSHIDEINIGKGGNFLGLTLHLPLIPVTRVENFCASGTEAFRGACYGVASGAYDIALAFGIEKLKDTGYGGLPDSPAFGQMATMVMPNATAPGMFAQLGSAYSAAYDVPMERVKEAMAHVSWKSHQNGVNNPRAHLRRAVTMEQILGSPMIAYPLGLFDCCGVSDGSAAAIVVPADKAKNYRPDPVYVKALQISVCPSEGELRADYDFTQVKATTRAGEMAYAEAGVKNPRKEISMAELHDCFSITEAVTCEDLQFSSRGKVKDDIESGFFDLTGGLPVQPDGGLKSFGHPIGASGVRMLYEMYLQLQGRADKRQLKNPKLGLTHNLGGIPVSNTVSVLIIGL